MHKLFKLQRLSLTPASIAPESTGKYVSLKHLACELTTARRPKLRAGINASLEDKGEPTVQIVMPLDSSILFASLFDPPICRLLRLGLRGAPIEPYWSFLGNACIEFRLD